MSFIFHCRGHGNILSTHRNTIEFTKEKELSLRGDCILGVDADFDFAALRQFLAGKKQIRATVSIGGISDTFSFIPNPDFSDAHELVIRKTGFNSTRTLGFHADKAAKDISRELAKKAKDKNAVLTITFT